MRAVFAETGWFTRHLREYIEHDEDYLRLQLSLMEAPEQGTVIQGTSGIRKMRWPDPRRGKGKRGGLRVIYAWFPEFDRFLLMAMYDKDEMIDLNSAEKVNLSRLVDEYRATLRESGGKP